MNALVDTLRQRRIEALARRAAAHQGEARRLLVNKQQLLQARSDADAPPAGTAAPPQASALAGLLADIARHSPNGTGLKTVHEHRSTWAQLHVDQRLHQAQVRLPDNAGPLNTQRLLLQALSLMRDASPQYLQHFLAHAETLLWLEATSPARVQPRKEPARPRRRTPR
jgi:hypothetical protein